MSLRDWAPQIRWFGGAIVIGFALGIASLAFQQCRGSSPMDPVLANQIVRYDSTRARDSSAHAALVTSGDSLVAVVHQSMPQTHRTIARADSLSHLGDSLAVVAAQAATAQDSARNWQAAFQVEKERGDSLVKVVGRVEQERDQALLASARYRTADSSSQARLSLSDSLNRGLRKELERTTSCRILPGIPCPSRVVVALATAGGVLIARR